MNSDMKTLKGKCLKYFKCFGLRDLESKQLTNLLVSWVESSGVEWTVKRFKSLKVAYIRSIAGLEDPFKYSPWLSKDRHGRLTGPLKAIFRLPKADAIGCLMVYSVFQLKVASKPQLKKFTEAVESTLVDPWTNQEMDDLVSSVPLKEFRESHRNSVFSVLSTWYMRETKVPLFVDEGLNRIASVNNSLEALLESASHPIASQYMAYLARKRTLPDDIYNVYARSVAEPWNKDWSDLSRNVVGKVGFIQEPGCKLRTVASPFPIFQLLTSRMGNRLYRILRDIPEDCTHDQDKGVLEIQNAMKQGISVAALDLSSATDRFPAEVTFKLLSTFGFPEEDIQLFRDLSRGIWKLPNGKEISWTNGQPLGLYPSFAAFALSHHLVVQLVKPKFYRILGDDLVISTDALESITKMYEKLGVPISEDKSINSPILTEFGGRIITKDDILAQPKWRDVSDRNFVDLAQSYGPKVVHILKPRQLKVIEILGMMPRGTHAYALGWNPKGLSYDERFELSEPYLVQLSGSSLEQKESSVARNSRLLYESRLLLLSEYPLRYFENRAKENLSANSRDLLSGNTKTRLLANANITRLQVEKGEDAHDETLGFEADRKSVV